MLVTMDREGVLEINANGHINATKLCQTTGKMWGHYYENR